VPGPGASAAPAVPKAPTASNDKPGAKKPDVAASALPPKAPSGTPPLKPDMTPTGSIKRGPQVIFGTAR
jgi:hypothetical protein